MNLVFMKQHALDTLKQNLHTIYTKYFTESTNAWVYELCGDDVFEDSGIEVDDFELASLNVQKSAGEIDLQNCKIIYSNLMALNETQASDERLWAGLSHGQFYDYMRLRWQYDKRGPQNPKADENEIKTRFFFAGGVRTGFFRHTLAKCWWVGKAMYSPDKDNPFRKLDILGSSDLNSKVTAIFYSYKFSSNPTIVDGIIDAFYHYNLHGVPLVEKVHIRPTMSVLNAIGGRIVLDCLSSEEVKNIVIGIIDDIIGGKTSIDLEEYKTEEEKEDEVVIEPEKQKVFEGNTVVLRPLGGGKDKQFIIKKINGIIPHFAESLIGKEIYEEVKYDDKIYVISEIK